MKFTLKCSSLLTIVLLTGMLTGTAKAALTVTLHLNGSGNTTVSVKGSGVTSATCTSQLCNGTSLQEQWSNMSGNPFDDTVNLNNVDFTFVNPIALTPSVSITGIQIDNDGVGDNQDDFKIITSANMNTSTAYNVNAITELTAPLAFSALDVGSYTDDTDGGTTFLNGFTLTITTDAASTIPEPSTALLTSLGILGLSLRRSRQ